MQTTVRNTSIWTDNNWHVWRRKIYKHCTILMEDRRNVKPHVIKCNTFLLTPLLNVCVLKPVQDKWGYLKFNLSNPFPDKYSRAEWFLREKNWALSKLWQIVLGLQLQTFTFLYCFLTWRRASENYISLTLFWAKI